MHRVFRLWPCYIVAILIYRALMIHIGDGPLWYKIYNLGEIAYCQNMWKSILFADNLVWNGEKMCLGWGWYLQNDMQIFVASLPILYIYTKNRKWAFGTIFLIITLSLLYNFIQAEINGYIVVTHMSDLANYHKYFVNVYIKPWFRCPPYLYGLLLGLFYV